MGSTLPLQSGLFFFSSLSRQSIALLLYSWTSSLFEDLSSVHLALSCSRYCISIRSFCSAVLAALYLSSRTSLSLTLSAVHLALSCSRHCFSLHSFCSTVLAAPSSIVGSLSLFNALSSTSSSLLLLLLPQPSFLLFCCFGSTLPL